MSATVTKERPILFSGEMVRAILEGRKTQTRRVVKLGDPDYSNCRYIPHNSEMVWRFDYSLHGGGTSWEDHNCPYGQPGDRLWVREAWAKSVRDPEGPSWDDDADHENFDILYRATDEGYEWTDAVGDPVSAPWKPSIHMPRWASRLTLEVTGVRVERLQEIKRRDAIAEGVDDNDSINVGRKIANEKVRMRFAILWDSINSKRGYDWDSNPWVWVVEFKTVKETP